ncbi:cupin-like domain-containing protein [Nisaea sp.]|uniref:cupin-like domain-containing protein n=1 Tax=Nisaea sp. TaxID=2024842 RepID=UPI0032EB8777
MRAREGQTADETAVPAEELCIRRGLRDVRVDRVTSISREDLASSYLEGDGRPVILTGVMQQWPAMTKWNFDFFREKYGEDVVLVADKLAGATEIKETHLSTYLDYIEDKRHTWLKHCELDTPWYLGFYKPLAMHPELMEDFTEPECLDNWCRYLEGEMADWYRMGFGWIFIGPGGTYTRPHPDLFATHAWLAQLVGRKTYFLSEPLDDPQRISTLTEKDFFQVDLEPGEFLLLPANWIHGAVSHAPSITLSFNFVNQRNFSRFMKTICRDADRWRSMTRFVGEKVDPAKMTAELSAFAPGRK